jgi:hypothetical protein
MSLNLSKSLSDALLFCTVSLLPHELFSHLFFTSAIKEQFKFSKKKKQQIKQGQE